MSTQQSGQIARPAATPLSRIESQYRSALAQRWLALVVRSAVFSSGIITLIVSARAGASVKAAVLSLLAALAAYPFAIYPILSSRRAILISRHTAPLNSSLISLFSSSLFSSQSIRYLSAHLSSGAILAAVYAIVLNLAQPINELGCLATTPRHPLHLNERFIFLLFGNAGMMLSLGVWDLLARRLQVSWPTRNTPLAAAVQNGLLAAIPVPGETNSLTISSVWLGLYSLSYFAVRKRVWIFLLTHTFGVLRPFMINFTKPSRSLGVSIIPHLLVSEVITILAARLPPIGAITPYLSLPLNFEGLRRKSPFTPEQQLSTMLKSKNPYYLHFTLMELLRVSHNPSRRQALFAVTSKTQPPILAIWEDLLLHLGRAHQTLISRGGARTASSAPASRPAPVQDTHTVQVRQANIFRPAPSAKTSGITRSLQSALEGPVQSAPPALLAKAQTLALDARGKAEAKAVEWQGEVMGRVEKSEVGGTVLKEARGVWAGIGEWVGAEWVERNAKGSLPEVVVIERIMDIFASLACASLEEDTYGYVQQVLPATLEIIVRHRSALMAFESELMMGASHLGRGNERAQRDVKAKMAVPISACESCIRRIADAFGESLVAFRFPPAVGGALAGICQTRTVAQPS
ncbi:nucleoporin protein Ndc1-Nup [Dioszegia hungarica]|uniref:Nucleoporin protein Ndc1-Nup n=1 Tax=Dioszegia hungarica TaxID=4972 RepID=A0AA38GZP2_9TREE|nr:nucleoporin protein Ndc1-Nup [Dioszegia hungarica]KAI9631893.1 nucleoporin protein Ndc1-Nup [Dioszegia hungarica]